MSEIGKDNGLKQACLVGKRHGQSTALVKNDVQSYTILRIAWSSKRIRVPLRPKGGEADPEGGGNGSLYYECSIGS